MAHNPGDQSTSYPVQDPGSVLLSLDRVGKHYGRTVALRNISLEIQKGQRYVLFGRNGAGKTTLLRIASGLTRPSEGQVRYNAGENATTLHRSCGYLSHALSMYEGLTAEENLLFYARLHKIKNGQKRIEHLLKLVELDQWANSVVRGFSRGMQQRLGIARALLPDPELLLFDEPYTGLDASAAALLSGILQSRSEMTLIVTSHDFERGLQLATKMAILDQGRLVFQQPVTTANQEPLRQAYNQWVSQKGASC